MVTFNSSTQKGVWVLIAALLSGGITIILFGSLFHYVWMSWQIDPFYKHGLWILLLSIFLYGKFLRSFKTFSFFPFERGNIRAATTAFFTFIVFFVMGIQTRLPWFGGVALLAWLFTLPIFFFWILSRARSGHAVLA